MTTLNAKANTAYNELIAAVEQDPDYVWAGFDHERDAFETGYEAGYKAAPVPVVDQDALGDQIADVLCGYGVADGALLPALARREIANAVLALLNGRTS